MLGNLNYHIKYLCVKSNKMLKYNVNTDVGNKYFKREYPSELCKNKYTYIWEDKQITVDTWQNNCIIYI